MSGLAYRVESILGSCILIALVTYLSNLPGVQKFFTEDVPFFNRLDPTVLSNGNLGFVILVMLGVFLVSLMPLYKPRPRRILDTILETQKMVVIGSLGLAAIGFYNYTYSIPRPTLLLITVALLVVLPIYFVYLNRKNVEAGSSILVGDDPNTMAEIAENANRSFKGYVSPLEVYRVITNKSQARTDGGLIHKHDTEENVLEELEWLGTFTRLDDLINDLNIDTVVLAFKRTDRSNFFGILDTCYENGIQVKAHWEHIDNVLIDPSYSGEADIVDIKLEPLDAQDYVLKRGFDVAFSMLALLVLSPVILVLAVAIKLDSPGPVFYRQERTAEFGGTFNVYKFRSMLPESEIPDPDDDRKKDRITRVGKVIRKTHLDEIPQLFSILVGDMSVVGPRAVWRDEEILLEEQTDMWRKRWFIKPGLTGLAQINKASSKEPEKKLRYDLQYIRDQSFLLDLKIVTRQIWMVVSDTFGFVLGEEDLDELQE
ncbi:MAG: sugar transferase [Halobacteria archaeon]